MSIKAKPVSFIIAAAAGWLLSPAVALAHCPLCTAGAGLAALAAYRLGVGAASVGIFIGAFAVALGLWAARLLKKQYLPGQRWWLAALSYLLTVLPLRPFFSDYVSIYLASGGPYGRVYPINLFLAGSLVGAIILIAAPSLSARLTKWRQGKMFPYQGMALTFVLLILLSVGIELFRRL